MVKGVYFVSWSDTLTPSLAVESSDSASGPSPRVLSARQRKVSHGCSEENTPKTPKSAVMPSSSSRVSDDRVFFGSNFNVERFRDLPTMSRPTLGLSCCITLGLLCCTTLGLSCCMHISFSQTVHKGFHSETFSRWSLACGDNKNKNNNNNIIIN